MQARLFLGLVLQMQYIFFVFNYFYNYLVLGEFLIKHN